MVRVDSRQDLWNRYRQELRNHEYVVELFYHEPLNGDLNRLLEEVQEAIMVLEETLFKD